jgi:serine-type D-Ala-D-Ala carboxypeptidase/endopeptidase
MWRPGFGALALSLAWVATAGPTAPAGRGPTDADVQALLVRRIDSEHQSVGIVVGVLDAQGPRVIAYGHLEKGDPRPLDGDTLFEIGSITKVFTALLLTDMVQHGEVKLDDPVSQYLPSTVKVPERDGRAITLADLATHTSGLPRMPTNFRPADPNNPYVDYTTEQLYAFLSSYELIRAPGVKFEYSNLGFGLLGQALARRAGLDYETLVVRRICDPLGMTSTRISLTPQMTQRFAAGHSADLLTVPRWDIPALAGAGALRSTANDMLKFMAAAMGRTRTQLAPALQALLSVRRPTGAPFVDSALGWEVDTRGGGELVWKNGGTGGYRTFVGYAPGSGVGIVVLSNAESESGVDDLGLHLLDARFPLVVPAGTPSEAGLAPERLERYVGHYELTPGLVLAVTREADQLYAQLTGQPRVAVYPKSDGEFFYKVVDAQLSFENDSTGQVTAVVLHQGGRDRRAARITAEQARAIEETLARRFKQQTPMPGSEAAIRRMVGELQRHESYSDLTPEFAKIANDHAAQSEALIAELGALQTVTFKAVGPGGADIYRLQFANGLIEWRIALTPEGKVAGVSFRKIE